MVEYNRNIIWAEDNYVVGEKIEMIIRETDLDSAERIDFYNGDEMVNDIASEYRKNVSDEDLIAVHGLMSDMTSDFGDSISAWGRAKKGYTSSQTEDFSRDIEVLTQVMDMTSSGFTKLFVLYHKILLKPDVIFLNNPGSSLHPNLSRAILPHMKLISPSTKFIITDAREFVTLHKNIKL